MPGMRGGAPVPNFFMPMVQRGQQGPRPGGRRPGGAPGQQNQQPVPTMIQQQVTVSLTVNTSFSQYPIILFLH